MLRGYMESSLASSEIFQGLNSEMKIQDRAVNLIKNSKQLKNTDIETAYIAVKQITDTLTRESLKAFDEERVVLIYNNVPQLTLSQAIPFMTFKTKDGYRTYIFADKYITLSRDGVLTMQASILRDLLTGAAVANGIKRNYNNLSNNQYLANITMDMYDKFITRVLNREYSVAIKKDEFDIIQYWINRYFLERVFGLVDSMENVDKLAGAHIKFLDEIQVNESKRQYNDAAISNFSDMLNLVKTLSPRMNSLSIGTFLNSWINYYYAPATLACDNIEYLLFMCITLLSGNNIINIGASDVVKEAKGIKSFRMELLKLV